MFISNEIGKQWAKRLTGVFVFILFYFLSSSSFIQSKAPFEYPKESSDAHRIHNLYKRSLIKFNKLCVPFCCLAVSCVVMHVKYIISVMCSISFYFQKCIVNALLVTIKTSADTLVNSCERPLHLSVYRIYSISISLSLHGIEPLQCSYWIVQVDSSASHHHHHWCAKWNLPIEWTSMHILQYIADVYIKIWPLRLLVKLDYWNHIQNYYSLLLNTLAIEWFFAPYAHTFGKQKWKKIVFISMQNDNGKYGNMVLFVCLHVAPAISI